MAIYVTLGSTSPPRNIQWQVSFDDIYPRRAGQSSRININMENCVNILIHVVANGIYGLDGVPGGVIEQGYADGAFAIPLYNGYYGQNPRGPLVQALLTPTGGSAPSGFIVVTISSNDFSNSNIIYLSGGIGADFVRDEFHGVNNTPIYQHSPDYFPDTTPGGQIAGYHGRGAYGNIISGNKLVTGGNEGFFQYTRIWSYRNNNQKIYIDVTRKAGSTNSYGVLGRMNGIPGNDDTGVDHYIFSTENLDDNRQYLWFVQQNAAGTPLFVASRFATVNWAVGDSKRMMMMIIDSSVYLFTADVVTGDNPQLVYTTTLSAPVWNDSSHQYVGFATVHYTDGTEMTEFFAGTLDAVAQPSGSNMESLAPVQAAA